MTDNFITVTNHKKNRILKYKARQPYCATCFRAGKSYEEYTSHWTKTTPGPDGIVVCPVILDTICSYCHEKGHWLKFCKKLLKSRPFYSADETDIIQFKTVDEDDNNPLFVSVTNELSLNQDGNMEFESTNDTSESNINGGVEESVGVNESITTIFDSETFIRPDSPSYPPPDMDEYIDDAVVQSETNKILSDLTEKISSEAVEMKRSYSEIVSSDSSFLNKVYRGNCIQTDTKQQETHTFSTDKYIYPTKEVKPTNITATISETSNNFLRILKKDTSTDKFSFSEYNIADEEYWCNDM
jgi:hypothetical protein